MSSYLIRRIKPGETALYKSLRLQALKDAPGAFCSTYADALQRSEAEWKSFADGASMGSEKAIFIAFDAQNPVGMGAIYQLEPGLGEMIQFWIAATYRGQGLAVELLNGLKNWASEHNFHQIQAGVIPDNQRALQFYLRQGFEINKHDPKTTSQEVRLIQYLI